MGTTWTWTTITNKTLSTKGFARVHVTDVVQRGLVYYVDHLRPLVLEDLKTNGKRYDLLHQKRAHQCYLYTAGSLETVTFV